MIESDPKWERVRESVQKAIDSVKKPITLQQAKEQIEKFKKN